MATNMNFNIGPFMYFSSQRDGKSGSKYSKFKKVWWSEWYLKLLLIYYLPKVIADGTPYPKFAHIAMNLFNAILSKQVKWVKSWTKTWSAWLNVAPNT